MNCFENIRTDDIFILLFSNIYHFFNKKVKKTVDIYKIIYYNVGVGARECPPTRNERNKK